MSCHVDMVHLNELEKDINPIFFKVFFEKKDPMRQIKLIEEMFHLVRQIGSIKQHNENQ